jgi:hypothetical protein
LSSSGVKSIATMRFEPTLITGRWRSLTGMANLQLWLGELCSFRLSVQCL